MEKVHLSLNSDFEIRDSSSHETFNLDGYRLLIMGHVYGAILGNEVKNKSELIVLIQKALNNQDKLDSLVSNAIGDFYLIVFKKGDMTVYASMSAPSLFYYKAPNLDLYFSNQEYDIYTKYGLESHLDESELIVHILSHHILSRNPFHSLYKEIKKVIPGSRLTWSQSTETRFLYFLNSRYNLGKFKDKQARFSFLLEQTSKTLLESIEGEVLLLKSGGIDSSTILAAVQNIKCLHVPYSGEDHPTVKMAKEIANDFGNKLVLASVDKNANLNKLKLKAISGFATIPGLQYLHTGVSFGEKGNKRYALSGQNLDTLYYVDTFAPLSNVTGYNRDVYTLLKFPQRSIYFWMYHSRNWRFLLKPILGSDHKFSKFSEFLKLLSISREEHTVLNTKEKYPKEIETLRKIYVKNREEHLYKTSKAILEDHYKKSLDEFSTDEKLRSIKAFRWCRTVHNVPTTYQNLKDSDLFERVILFNHGPLATYFLNYKISFREMMTIKPLNHAYFRKKMKKYSSYVKKHGKYTSWGKGVYKKISRSLGLAPTIESKKGKSQDFTAQLHTLRELLKSTDFDTGFLKKDETISLFDYCYDLVMNFEKHTWDKEKGMMACRFVNSLFMLNSIKNSNAKNE